MFAVALGLADGWFRPFVTHSTDTLRTIHYETHPGDPDPLDGQVGMGAHTDYGIVTVLYADPVPGLQVLGPDHALARRRAGARRVPRQPRRPHRAVDERPLALDAAPGAAAGPPARSARTTADRSRSSTTATTTPSSSACRRAGRAGDPPRYPPVTAGEHLMGKLLGPRTGTASVAADTAGDRLAAVRRR